MRLAIDAREIEGGVTTGIGRPLYNFLQYFARQNNEDSCVLFSGRDIPFDFGPRIKTIVIKERFTLYWDQIVLPQAIKKEGIDLFYSPYYKIPLRAPCKVVSAILDLMYIFLEEYRQQLGFLRERYYQTGGARYAQSAFKILTCSQHSRHDIIRFYHVKEEKIVVIPLSVSSIYRVEKDQAKILEFKAKFKLPLQYLLYVGNLKPHKNVKSIILAFEKLAADFPDLHLVIAGPRAHTFRELCALTEEANLQDRVIFIGKITESDEPHLLYNGACVFVMPSLYEGFGLPPAEAMACGVPVVTSNTTSIPEVVKDAGILVNPTDTVEIARGIRQLLRDKDLRARCIQKGLTYAQEYEEDKVSRRMYDFFKNLVN